MRTFIKFIIAAILTSLIGLKVVQADYRVTNYQQEVHIAENGTANIDKTVTYKFDDDMNGVYLKESLTKPVNGNKPYQWGGLQTITIARNGEKARPITPRVGDENIGYVTSKTRSSVQEKVYYPIKANDDITVRYTYRLKDLIINWDDVSELNWRIISNWDQTLENVKITVLLPKQPAKTLKGWVHSSAIGHLTINKKRAELRVTTARVKANHTLELHTYFDKSQTPLNTNIQPGHRAKIISQSEAERTIKYNKTLRMIAICGFIVLPIVFLALFALILWYKFRIRNQLRHTQQKSGINMGTVHIYDIPNDLGPALINARIKQQADISKVIVATLMDLIARKKVTITYQNVSDVDHAVYRVVDESGLRQFESLLIDMIFGKKRVDVYQHEFQKPESLVSKRIHKGIDKFQREITAAEDKDSIIDSVTTNKVTSTKILMMALLVIVGGSAIIGLLFMANYSNIWQLWLVAGGMFIMSLVGLLILKQQSTIFFTVPDGVIEKWQWTGFAAMLHDIANLDNKTVLDVQLWDKLLAYAVIFGEANQVAKTLKRWAEDANISVINLPVYMIYSSFGANWSVNLANNIQTNAGFESNVSGNGGSFSGGYSGGGGGGGGGAF
ncbi:DUF2207 domain-containing protein [Leuconostoc gelidum subsp. gelidum]|uniref:DUF2207 domain-containing protein n=1 Tax=Leuconostoc gelidum subsp. gelidum TaxID=1607839 RepID=A0AB35G2D5_LEUGE|nr:DUF2207 domain-containing protein [Leuconostoc gelidum]MBZ5964562.1 DUF2207 domain-containing protein [Leuconostoc gelidum subsp. gelidum]MBZ5974833.1 DUF2207 domain-containing protein [Leuconostoc gelidum subsp. gelidum]MBZ5977673.1 DUF2207 domain-containing protein [Leuconostoc gelidum subsp. gelidum]MBZ5986389.1 DUF2207 domain-containing protein [Leuconostoc gelidum subsp. gelidum]MBZ5999384.1 DUF2207 domain-containing protein [Leuconostoc gelidum subsp. gelidum]